MPATTFTELLPPTKHAPGLGFKWTPSEDRIGCGLLLIEAVRVRVSYLVVEFATRWDGRAWHLAKVDVGTDKESESYDVFVGRNGQDRQCSCKGFAYGRGKPCKHLESLISILANHWDGCPVNEETDVSSTEIHDQPEQF